MSLENNANPGRNGFDPDFLFWVNLRWLLYKVLRNVHNVPTPRIYIRKFVRKTYSGHTLKLHFKENSQTFILPSK